MAQPLDVVYPVKVVRHNRELRYSLRTLQNLPHRNVIIAGQLPRWVQGVIHIPLPQRDTKYANARANILAAARHPHTSDDFILMNDDFYIMAPIAKVPHLHRGDMDEFMGWFPHRRAYWDLMVSTRELLRELGIRKPKFYELHIPTVYNKGKLLEMVERFEGRSYMMRTLYHNLYPSRGRYRDDVKKHRSGDSFDESDFLSSSNAIGRKTAFKTFMSERFPERSPYEC